MLSLASSKINSSSVACFAINRLMCHLNLLKRIDKQGARNEHLNNRFFTTASNGKISMVDHSYLATDQHSISRKPSLTEFVSCNADQSKDYVFRALNDSYQEKEWFLTWVYTSKLARLHSGSHKISQYRSIREGSEYMFWLFWIRSKVEAWVEIEIWIRRGAYFVHEQKDANTCIWQSTFSVENKIWILSEPPRSSCARQY